MASRSDCLDRLSCARCTPRVTLGLFMKLCSSHSGSLAHLSTRTRSLTSSLTPSLTVALLRLSMMHRLGSCLRVTCSLPEFVPVGPAIMVLTSYLKDGTFHRLRGGRLILRTLHRRIEELGFLDTRPLQPGQKKRRLQQRSFAALCASFPWFPGMPLKGKVWQHRRSRSYAPRIFALGIETKMLTKMECMEFREKRCCVERTIEQTPGEQLPHPETRSPENVR